MDVITATAAGVVSLLALLAYLGDHYPEPLRPHPPPRRPRAPRGPFRTPASGPFGAPR